MIPRLIPQLLILFFGTLWPGYETFKALEQRHLVKRTNWLKYWVIYAELVCLIKLTDLVFFWLPLYEECKLITVLLLLISAPGSSVWLFDIVIHPLLSRNEFHLKLIILMIGDKMYIMLKKIIDGTCAWLKSVVKPLVIETMRCKLYPLLLADAKDELLLKAACNKNNFNDVDQRPNIVKHSDDENVSDREDVGVEWHSCNANLPNFNNTDEDFSQPETFQLPNTRPFTRKIDVEEVLATLHKSNLAEPRRTFSATYARTGQGDV